MRKPLYCSIRWAGLEFPNLVGSTIVLPFDESGGFGSRTICSVFCPQNKLVYIMGVDQTNFQGLLTRFNTVTGMFQNTQPTPFHGSSAPFPFVDPNSNLVYIKSENFNTVDIYCSFTDTLIGGISAGLFFQGAVINADKSIWFVNGTNLLEYQ